MAYINGNKPIVTDGLIYALDFGNHKSYTSGSTTANSLAYDESTTIVTGSTNVNYVFGSTALPVYNNGILEFTGTQYIKRINPLHVLNSSSTFTIMIVGKTTGNGLLLHQDSLNISTNPTSSLFGFGLNSGNLSRSYPGFTSSSLQHVTYRYSQGTIDTFINGIPVTASTANSILTTTAVSNALFLGDTDINLITGYAGALAQFYVYNRALSADEIYTTYLVSAERNGLPTVPKPYTQDENVYKYIQTTGITDLDTISAIDTFVSNLKSNGLWNKMTAIYPFLTVSTGSQAINLKDPGVLGLGLTGSFTGSNVGLTPTSTTAYIDTLPSNIPYPFINSASAHLSLLSYDVPQGNGFLAGNSAPAAGGDLIIQSGSRMYHIYKNVGTSSFAMPDPSITDVEVIVVAGGGAGGSGTGGGGGAGGLIYSASYTITPGIIMPVIVGNGGAAPPLRTPGQNGQNSVFNDIVAIGGGGGSSVGGPAGNGGSGGGGSTYTFNNSGSGIPGQGYDGANGIYPDGGGGGGAGAVAILKNGGSGSFFSQYAGLGLGSPAGWFAGGGAGSATSNQGLGGIGGGGNALRSGSANTGGGGGASWYHASVTLGSGGSGIVIVSYNAYTNLTAFTGSGTGFYLTDSALTASVNSQFTSGITGSGNIGFLTVSRTGSNSFSIRKNNLTLTINSASLGALSTDIFFNSVNLVGSGSLPQPTSISYASIGAGLTDSEVSTYYNLVSQFQTNLKRQNTLLDNYSGAAAAYSLRRIGPSGYFGPAIRVRRDSDNALRDIGFTSDGQLDTVGLLDFVGVTGSGFVQTWYDQSGNSYDLAQGTTTAQPLIIGSGSVFTDTNRPAVYFDGGDSLSSLSNTQTMDYLSAYILARPLTDPASGYGWWRIGDGYKVFLGYSNDINRLYYDKAGAASTYLSSIQAGKKQLLTIDADTTGFTIYDNNTLSQTVNKTGILGGGTQITLGTSGYGTSPVIFQENIIYPESRKTTTLSDVNSNILSAYTTGSDPDYQAFITATGITEPTQSAALETLVSDLKSYGLWDKMKAVYPMVTDKNNRFSRSEDFSTTWTKVSSSVTVDQITAPDGTSTADLILEEAGSGEHYFYETVNNMVSGNEYVLSIYGKFYNRPWIALQTNEGAQAWFDLQNGATGSFTGSSVSITDVGSGWYRCALFFTGSTDGARNQHIHLADADSNFSYTGATDSGSYLWGAQFENGNLLGPYRKTEGSSFTTGSMLDQMKYNLKDTGSFSGSYFGGWNPGYSGNKPNGVNGYMDTNLLPSTQLTVSTNNITIYSRTNSTKNSYEYSAFASGTSGVYLSCRRSTGNLLAVSVVESGTNTINISNTNSEGFYQVNRQSNTLFKVFRNLSTLATNTNPTTGTMPNLNIYLAAENFNGALCCYSNRENAFTTIGDGLTDYEAKALYWIVQKFQTTLGRQVY